VTDVEIGAFLSSPRSPEQIALLRLIGTLMLDPQGTDAGAEPSAVNTAREWSDAELTELGNMLVRGLSMEEIARLLRRDHGDVQDKVVEVGWPAVNRARGPTCRNRQAAVRLPITTSPVEVIGLCSWRAGMHA
jgi:hypothetical protein